MSRIDAALWRDIMDYLRDRHPAICRQWFEELSPLGLHSGLLKVHTANGVQKNYLQRKCLEPFTEAAQAVTGALIAVQFVDADDDPSDDIAAEHGGAGLASAGDMSGDHYSDVGESRTGSGSGGSGSGGSSVGKAGGNVGGNVGGGGSRSPESMARSRPARDPFESDNDEIILSPDFSFDHFVTGPGNQLAHAASIAVANNPGHAYNPLFIHGGVGLGKTHLLQAICQTILRDDPRKTICYLSCDTFINQFLDCVQTGQMAEFRHRYRHVDVLVIDDIHFLANRERTQEEFFHTFNELYQSKRQIVISSDSPPNEIPQLEERLISRFQWGLVATVSKPTYETRVAIVKAKVLLRGIEIPEDVVSYIANRIDSNARELEGAITTIQGHGSLQNRAITLELAKEALGDTGRSGPISQTSLQQIIDAVTGFYNVKLSDLQSKRRHKSITEPRQVCMWLARKRTRFSLQEIGGYFGGRDHTTVMHSIRIVDQRMGQDRTFEHQVTQIDERLS